ncbi:MAG: DUF748 domain-containing protein, partial [Myxococcota bacterium]
LKVDVAPSELLDMKVRLAAITVQDPAVNVSIDGEGVLNLLSQVPKTDAKDKDAGGAGVAAKDDQKGKIGLFVDTVRLSGGTVRFSDESRARPFRTELRQLRIDVDNLDLYGKKQAGFLVSFATEAGESVEIKGGVALFPPVSEGKVAVRKLLLGKYAPYFAGAVRFEILSGTLDLELGYRYASSKAKSEISLFGLGAALADLRLQLREESSEFLKIRSLAVKDAAIDPGEGSVTIGEFRTAGAEISVRRSDSGELNVNRLVPAGRPAPKGKPSKPWTITVKKVDVDQYAVRFKDRSTKPSVNIALDRLKLQAENLTTSRGGRSNFTFSTSYNGTGSLSLGGTFTSDPVSASVRIRARALPIGPVQPYFADRVKVLITGGTISADGSATVDAPAGKPLHVTYRGELGANNFASLDKAVGEDFLKFSSLHVGGVEVGYNPTSAVIKEISLTDFYSRIILNQDGTLNLQGIISAPETAQTQPPPPAQPAPVADGPAPVIPVRIDSVTLLGGSINFSDRYIKPNYSASLGEIGGRITGLSSEESKLAEVELRGKLENSAPLDIRGKVNPLAKDLYLDLSVDFKDWDLPPLSPYSGRYAGYAIQKGKLAMNLKYHIEKRALTSENKVFLDQFTFGEKVDSPDATRLPVKLAVALLQDRNGAIHLDLPVTGTIDDPKFKVWGIVWQVVKNILVKASTAPFEFLAGLFKGGPDLSFLEFEPGQEKVTAAEEVKLNNLEKALYDRPGLKLEIVGYVDLESDREGLKRLALKRKVAALKAERMAKSGETVPQIDSVTFDPAEYQKYLTRVYTQEKFPKPRNAIGMVKELSVPEMEKLILTNMQISDDDLLQLSKNRASHAREHLVASGKVAGERVFLVKSTSLQPEHKDKQKNSRVDFRIK